MIAPGSDGPAQPGASSGACQPASLSGASHSASLEGQASLSGDSGPASLSGASQPASLEGQGSFSGDCEPAPFGGAFQPASIPELEDLVFDDTTSHTPHGVERRTRACQPVVITFRAVLLSLRYFRGASQPAAV